MTARRLLFWAGVSGVSLLSPFLLAVVTARVSWPGLKGFRNFTYGSDS